MSAAEVRTTCPYCGVGCGVLISKDTAGKVLVRGDPDHPANLGRLCSKGTALAETIGDDGRLLTPMLNGRAAGWGEATAHVADMFRRNIAAHGPDSVAFYVSGQLLTEDYYAANKLMKGFIGSANIDTNSRLCMASSVAGHRRAFGSDTVPGLYEDVELADLVVLVGSNLAWCHPVLHQRLMAAKAARPGMRIIVIDPRRTATAELADLHLAIRPGGDVALFNHLLARIADAGALAADLPDRVDGADAAIVVARATDPAATGLSDDALAAFCDAWIATPRVVTVYSQGVNQAADGSDKVNAILNCHLATGRIGRPGMGPFSVTGQPNAMGGREVGGLANMLAAHLELEDAKHCAAVRDFWRSPTIARRPGLKAVEMFEAVADGRIRALWIMCTNPAVSMPEADRVAKAIAACPFVVVSDMFATTDTARLAHVLLPATGWGEKDGTVTNSERRISRQRPFRAAPGAARPDWKIVADVARAMGYPGFDWTGPDQVFAEHATLSGIAGGLGGDFDISDHAGIGRAAYDRLSPFLWPANARKSGGRFFGDGRFHTTDGRARMLALGPAATSAATPGTVRLNTGRIRDQWHTMTRTGRSPRLGRHLGEPYLELHPQDAEAIGLRPADLVHVANDLGRATLRALVSDRVRPGEVFAPIHWTGETAPSGRIGALVPAVTDPVSGQPDLKAAPVSISRAAMAWYGFAVSSRVFRPDCAYWARVPVETGGMRAELAGTQMPADWTAWARALFGLDPGVTLAEVRDPARGRVRLAFHDGPRLLAALFIAPEPVALAREHVVARLLDPGAGEPLAGCAAAGRADPGPTICACLNVGLNTIRGAIETGQALTVEALGTALGAGTSCGSCRPELAALVAAHAPRLAAE